MAISITEINPIALTAVISSTTPYTVTLKYAGTDIGTGITDAFRIIPSTVTINISSSTVPAGHHLAGSGVGSTWSTISPSSISGAFPGVPAGTYYDFTVQILSGTTVVATHDPRLTLQKMTTEEPR